jgi:hypothetical protein
MIVDATIGESIASPRRQEIIETNPVGNEELPERQTFQVTELIVEEAKDPDARWLKKGEEMCLWI